MLNLTRFAYRRQCKKIIIFLFAFRYCISQANHQYQFQTCFAKSAHGRDTKGIHDVRMPLFHIHLVNLSSPLFTWASCANFIEKYVKMPKRQTARGTAGLTLPSMGMLTKCAMVLNGMFRLERKLFWSYLQLQEFQGKDKFFSEPTEDNPDWRQQYRKHSSKLKRLVQSNSLPNSEVIKACVLLHCSCSVMEVSTTLAPKF